MSKDINARREFLKKSALGTGALLLPWKINASSVHDFDENKTVRFGLCADVHKDIVPDADERLKIFIDRMKGEKVDFIMQMGDFCHPLPENKSLMEIWEQFPNPKYHMLGNHDMDLGTKKDIMDFWGMDRNYYSFDHGNFHFVVLDPNYIRKKGEEDFIDYAHANFYISYEERPFINDEQLVWLEEDLKATKLPTIIFSHQSLENEKWGVVNRDKLQKLFKTINEAAGFQKIIACLNGHHHVDYYKKLNDIHYLMINSMSYFWLGEDYQASRYDDEIESKYPHLKKVVPFEHSLYALVTLHPKGFLKIEGVDSAFVAPSPNELNYPKQPGWNRPEPIIRDRKMTF
ncbi:metallophosphoesterase [Fulvivirgaceae bacterium BMA10]|uniref:Metallophosphoesterase n=1 Tax=Splendidivirga corallicola TaxID=3051826 RepID=A0ABT8KVK3_9BACT|nr:metallophosphoesterase [Fulvivirgaceae bacterium BMA10]